MLEKTKIFLSKSIYNVSLYLKTDIKYVINQGSWLAGGEVVNNILGLILIIAFANLIPQATYGTYKYVLSIYGIFALFGLSGAGPAIIKSVASGNEGVYLPALKLQMKWGLLGSLGTLVVAAYYFTKANNVLGYCFVIAAISLPFFESLNTYQHILAGKKRFDLQTKFYSGTRIVSALSLIITLFFSKNVTVLIAAYFFPYIIANFIFGSLSLKNLGLNKNFDPNDLNYIRHLSFINIISYGVNYLESIIVFHFLGPIELAIYSIASAPASRVQSFFSIVPDVSLPKYAERPIEEIRATLLHRIIKASLICLAISLVIIFIIPLFFKLFLPKYINAIFYAQLFVIPLMWYPLGMLTRVLTAKGATKFLYKSSIIGSTLELTIMFIAIYYFGLLGAVVGRVIVSIISYPILYHYFKKL